MNHILKIVLFSLSVLLLAGCMSFQEAGIERGQTVFNRVSLRTAKENTIYYANRYYGGILIPAGTECTIDDVTLVPLSLLSTEMNMYSDNGS